MCGNGSYKNVLQTNNAITISVTFGPTIVIYIDIQRTVVIYERQEQQGTGTKQIGAYTATRTTRTTST